MVWEIPKIPLINTLFKLKSPKELEQTKLACKGWNLIKPGATEAEDVDDDGFAFKVFEGEVFIELDVPYNIYEIDDFKEKAIKLLGIDEAWIVSINYWWVLSREIIRCRSSKD